MEPFNKQAFLAKAQTYNLLPITFMGHDMFLKAYTRDVSKRLRAMYDDEATQDASFFESIAESLCDQHGQLLFTAEDLRQLPMKDLAEVDQHIYDHNGFGEKKVKNQTQS